MKLEKVRKSWNSLQMVFLYQNSEREVAWDLEMNINIVITATVTDSPENPFIYGEETFKMVQFLKTPQK